MATTLANCRQEVRGRYGLTYSTAEDGQFTNTHLNSLINDAYRWIVGLTRAFFDDALEVDLAHGQQSYQLSPLLIKTVNNGFRYQQSDDTADGWRPLEFRLYPSLLHEFKGSLENIAAGVPRFVSPLASDGEQVGRRILVLPAPKLGSGVTAKLRCAGWVYPPTLVNDDDPINLPDPDCFRLYAAVNLRMALWEKARGRQDAPVGDFAQLAGVEAAEMHRLEREASREPSRTTETRESPLAEALEQMRPATLGGG